MTNPAPTPAEALDAAIRDPSLHGNAEAILLRLAERGFAIVPVPVIAERLYQHHPLVEMDGQTLRAVMRRLGPERNDAVCECGYIGPSHFDHLILVLLQKETGKTP